MCSNKKNSEHCQAVAARFADYQHLSEELSYDAQQFGQQIMLLQSRVATLKQRLSQLEQSTRGDVDQRSDKLRQALLDSQQQLTMRLEMVAYYESPR